MTSWSRRRLTACFGLSIGGRPRARLMKSNVSFEIGRKRRIISGVIGKLSESNATESSLTPGCKEDFALFRRRFAETDDADDFLARFREDEGMESLLDPS